MNPHRAFETPEYIRKRVRQQVPFALVFCTLMIALLSTMLGALAGLMLGGSFAAGVVSAVAMFVLGVWPVGRVLLRKCDFQILLESSAIHVGKGFRRVDWTTHDIELIEVSDDVSRGHKFLKSTLAQQMKTAAMAPSDVGFVRVQGLGVSREVMMEPAEAIACGETLYAACPNALIVDPTGKTREPRSGAVPVAALRTLGYRHWLFSCWLWIATIGGGCLTIIAFADAFSGEPGHVPVRAAMFVGCLTSACAGGAIVEWRKSRGLYGRAASLWRVPAGTAGGARGNL